MTKELLLAIGIPSAVFSAALGFCVWLIKRWLTKQENKAEERERNREKLDVELVRSSMAAIALGEATAKAVQRIPDAHCNGDMSRALDYAAKIKHEQKDFLMGLGIHALHDD